MLHRHILRFFSPHYASLNFHHHNHYYNNNNNNNNSIRCFTSRSSVSAEGMGRKGEKYNERMELSSTRKESKAERFMKAYERTRWHKRQKQKDPDMYSEEPSKNQLFKQTFVPPDIKEFIQNNQFGIFRRDRRRKETVDKAYERTAVKYEELFKKTKFVFVASANSEKSFPQPHLPEVAFIGRSNVGKSSLINALTSSGKVKVSHKPGYTKTINFFCLRNSIMLVDLPGYGFAFAGTEKSQRWRTLVTSYLKTRPSLARVCLLLDARHGIKDRDREMIEMFEESNSKYQVILTKCDLVQQADLMRRYTLILQELKEKKSLVLPVIPCSSRNRDDRGRTILRSQIAKLAPGLAQSLEKTDSKNHYKKKGKVSRSEKNKKSSVHKTTIRKNNT